MKFTMLNFIATIFLLMAVSVVGQNPIVTIPGGSIITGSVVKGVENFQGIPFGQDTGGVNRFAPPKPVILIAGSTIDATQPGPACPQPVKFPAVTGTLESSVDFQSENCLNLRIARPAGTLPTANLPVMVYFYGGGFISGHIDDKVYEPDNFVNQAGVSGYPVIYVAINYRLSIFGFANSAALRTQKSLNVGLRDQRLGLDWVKAHIAAFGGNPNAITIFGQSAGASSIGLQVTAFGGKQPVPFNKAILQSGAPGSNIGTNSDVSSERFGRVAALCHCVNGDIGSAATLSCMRDVSLDILASVELNFANQTRPPTGHLVFAPVVDGDFIPDAPSTLVANGQFARDVSIIQGWNEDDGSIFTPTTIFDETAIASFLRSYTPGLSDPSLASIFKLYPLSDFAPFPAQRIDAQYVRASRIFRDIVFTCPALRFAEAIVQRGSTAFLYQLNQTVFTPDFAQQGTPEYGISHFSDIPYVFDEPSEVEIFDVGASDRDLATQISGAWSAFASSGKPCSKGSLNLCTWPTAFEKGDPVVKSRYLLLGSKNAGILYLTASPSPGATDSQKLWNRCAFIAGIQNELQA